MNKIAFIADIHSNITALEEVLKDIKNKQVDKVICVGDMIGKGPSPDKVIDILKKECYDIVIGNLETSIIEVETKIHGIWNRNKLGKERIKYIKKLKYSSNIMFLDRNITYFHTISKDNYLTDVIRIYEYSDENIKNKLFQVDNKADIIIYADIHKQYTQNINGKIIINTGSVGNKLTDKNEPILAEYVILKEGKENSLEIEFVKIPYDKDKEILITNSSDMPHKEKYITEMLTGKYINL